MAESVIFVLFVSVIGADWLFSLNVMCASPVIGCGAVVLFFSGSVRFFVEFMLQKQCPDIMKMRHNLDERIIEVQLRQLDADIRECMRQMQTGDSFSEEAFNRYESLKKERDALLMLQNEN